MTSSSYEVSATTADYPQEAVTAAVMVLTFVSRNIPVSAPKNGGYIT